MKHTAVLPSPVGNLRLEWSDDALTALSFTDEEPVGELFGIGAQTAQELSEYFAGVRSVFTVALAPEGTVFQKNIWQALAGIPYGKTMSYRQVAQAAGYGASYARAAGSAIGANGIVILLPCHRVVREDGKIGGFTGGVCKKQTLLALERR